MALGFLFFPIVLHTLLVCRSYLCWGSYPSIRIAYHHQTACAVQTLVNTSSILRIFTFYGEGRLATCLWQLTYVQILAGSPTDCRFLSLQLTMGPLLFFIYLVTAGCFLPTNCRLIGLQITPSNPHLDLFTSGSFFSFVCFFVQIANNFIYSRSFSFFH